MKNTLLLFLIVLFEVSGNTFLSHGMRLAGEISLASPSGFLTSGLHALQNPWVILGVVLLIGYFLVFLTALSRLELSYVLPMTAIGFVITALVAWKFLGETLSESRWLGTGLIGLGTIFVGLSE